MDRLEFMLNGRKLVERDVPPNTTLLQYLRDRLHLTGTKEGCAEGDCGACTVALVEADEGKAPTYRAVNACLVLLPMIHGRQVFTVEALRGPDGYHPVQESLVRELGSQCGYCTPGVVMSMFEACYRKDLDEPWKLDDQMCGNLCRCTGYRPIRDAASRIAGTRPDDRFLRVLESYVEGDRRLAYEAGAHRFFTPASFDELWRVLEAHPDARIVAGGTDLALLVTKQFVELPILVSLEGLGELRRIARTDTAWEIGATVALSDLEAAAKDGLEPVERMLRFFGSRQIKNRGTVGGNLCNASPIGDLAPIFLALGASLRLRSASGARVVPIDDFFTGYRKTRLLPGEILESVTVPAIPRDRDVRAAAYKVSKRQELDISAVAAGMYVAFDPNGAVEVARFGFGGMAATPARARRAESALIGRPFSEPAVEDAIRALAEDFAPIDDHRASAWYRRTVAANLIRGFCLETQGVRLPRLPHRPTGTVLPAPAGHDGREESA